jgi:hypothetical protein
VSRVLGAIGAPIGGIEPIRLNPRKALVVTVAASLALGVLGAPPEVTTMNTANVATTTRLRPSFGDEEFWSALNPELFRTVTHDEDPPLSCTHLALAEAARALTDDGYFVVEEALPAPFVASLAEGIARLDAAGVPPVFAFVYGGFWRAFRCMRPLLDLVLGPRYAAQPAFWAWYVAPERNGRGWPPHRDKGLLPPEVRRRSLTLWIPLTDAVPANGCMYVLPMSLDPELRGDPEAERSSVLQSIRALPAPAGSLLGWNQALLHWGGRSNARARQPRISIAFEFQAVDLSPWAHPLLDPDVVPPFESRLALIAMQVSQYGHLHGLSANMVERATSLLRRFPLPPSTALAGAWFTRRSRQ